MYRLWIKDGRTHKCILVLQDSMVILAHDYSGHNGSRRTYNCLNKQYHWPGIRKQVFHHCKCILQNQGQAEKGFSHFDSPDLTMEFICMDLVGPIHPPSSRGNKYVLMVIDMLMGFMMVVPIQNKNADTICDAYRDHIYYTFGGSSRILTDSGSSEFKNKEMKQVCEMLNISSLQCTLQNPMDVLKDDTDFSRLVLRSTFEEVESNGTNLNHLQSMPTISFHARAAKSLRLF